MDARKIREFAIHEFPDSKVLKSFCGYGIFVYQESISSSVVKKLNMNFKRWSISLQPRGLLIMVYE